MAVKLKLLSSLEKVFLDEVPFAGEYLRGSALKGEDFSFQMAFMCNNEAIALRFNAESDLNTELFIVENVPCEMPVYPEKNGNDGYFLRRAPGLYPDVMMPLPEDGKYIIKPDKWLSLWVSVKIPSDAKPGEHTVRLSVTSDEAYGINEEKSFTLKVIDAMLPKQELLFTQWFHTDCIADYYGVDVFSERHWELTESFMKMAADHGMNLILTPIFTPPLDTAVGGERTTVQLTDVTLKNGKYTFGFEKLGRWIDTAQRAGITHFEMAHLFTQWGAGHAPKIIANVDGVEKRIFGWETDAVGEEYSSFLRAYLPALSAYLHEKGVADKTFFHISDEPGEQHLEPFTAARDLVVSILGNEYPIIDALSSYTFYEKGVVKKPIPCNDHIMPFLEHNVPNLWTYYCCCQYNGVSNRFMAMPAARNRVIGLQLYKYDIEGFLHWGYNFYNTRYSIAHIDPFRVTDAGCSFPSGDSFSVYPAPDGAIPATRLKVFNEALTDLRAMKLLESVMPKEAIVAKIDEKFPITFKDYPHGAEYVLGMREWVNEKIEEMISNK